VRKKPLNQAAVPPAARIFVFARRNEQSGSVEHAIIVDWDNHPAFLAGGLSGGRIAGSQVL